MSTYAIGDIQGCYDELQQLLALVQFDPGQDRLWCVGDLVNRGPDSAKVLRFLKQLDQRVIAVLGNHDLHLLATAYQAARHAHAKDTLIDVLQAPDATELTDWLRHRPFLHHDEYLNLTLIHAGLPPQWDIQQARQYAHEIEQVLRDDTLCRDYLTNIYGSTSTQWTDTLTGWERLRFITNCFTRLRYCTEQGALALAIKGAPDSTNDSTSKPWFLMPQRASSKNQIIFGHWSTLGYYADNNVYALDTGCLWGGALTALRLEDKQVFQVACAGACKPEEA